MTDDQTPVIGACVDCDRPMLSQKVWAEHPELRPDRVRSAARQRCHCCYTRHLKQVRAEQLVGADCEPEPNIPQALRLKVEKRIALGSRTSQIMAQLDVPYEVVAGVREYLDQIVAAAS